MWNKLKDTLKEIFIKIKCHMCCKTNCSIQVGREAQKEEEQTQPNICETTV